MGKLGKVCATLCVTACGCPCGAGDVPFTPSRLTAAWLTRILQSNGDISGTNRVLRIELKPFAIGEGLMSIMYRVTAKLDKAPDGGLQRIRPHPDDPTSFCMVAKLSPPQLKPRILGDVLKLFVTEVRFYEKNLAARTGMGAPECFYAGHAGSGRYAMLLEDLSPAKTGDQLQGIPVEQARVAVKAMAKMHATFYGKVGKGQSVRSLEDDTRTTKEEKRREGESVCHPICTRSRVPLPRCPFARTKYFARSTAAAAHY